MKATIVWLVCALAVAGCANQVGDSSNNDEVSIENDVDNAVAAGEAMADSARAPTLEGALTSGNQATASFGAHAKYLAWNFDAQADQHIVITTAGQGAEIDTVALLYRATATGRPTGTAIAINDDDGMLVSSRIDTTAPRDGSYVAIVRRKDLGTTGTIHIALTISDASMHMGGGGSGSIAVLGGGTHSVNGLETTTLVTHATGLSGPRDLAFNPNADHELWVTSLSNNSMLIVSHASTRSQTTHLYNAEGGGHFMPKASGLAFGDSTMATCHEIDVATQSSTPASFMGPTLWRARADLFDGGWATHIDMLHNSPDAVGIAWDHANVFWVYDGYHHAITRYDFQRDHGPGGSDHSDGIVARFVQGSVGYVSGVSSAVELDHRSHLLYIADTSNRRIAVLDTTTGSRGNDIAPNFDGGEQYAMLGAQITTLVPRTAGLTKPSGLALHGGVLFVTDRATSIIHAYQLDGTEIDWLDLSSVVPAGSLGAIELDPEGHIYVTDVEHDKVVRIAAGG